MFKAILAVVIGYVVMVVFVMGSLTAAYFAMGADRAFEPGTYDVTMMWIVVMLVLGLCAALLGGLVSAVIAKPKSAAPKLLAGLVLLLGLAMAGANIAGVREDPGARGGDVSNVEAMTKAQQPMWSYFANPVVGCVGVLIGARMRGKA